MDSQRIVQCGKFLPNQFNRNRCQTCFRAMDAHSADALQSTKMNRKVTKCGFLYVAPEGIDVTNPTQKNKRWQRRWFALYDDGELSYALDQHADTVPQRVIDMTSCREVIEADELTGHSHSLRVNTQTDEQCYFKADNADDIKWWRDVLCMYSKSTAFRKMRMAVENGDCKHISSGNGHVDENGCGPTVIQVKQLPFRERSQRRTSDPLASTKTDIGRSQDYAYHGTPRSVKNRRTSRSKEEGRSKTFSEFDTSGLNICTGTTSTVLLVNEDSSSGESSNGTGGIKQAAKCPTSDGPNDVKMNGKMENKEEKSTDQRCPDTVCNQTLRKGWLMLKGASDNEWSKFWVVLAGLSLKMYKDAWAEDGCTDAAVLIDLSDCETIQQLSSARNYGIEIKCKHHRYVLSALTPGIRDSWIAAIGQNLASTSPIEPVINGSAPFSNSSHRVEQPKKKRIAYVAPESHRRDATCETDGGEDDDEDVDSVRSNSRVDEVSVSGRSVESSTQELPSDDGEASSYSTVSTPRRRRSLSPTIRRSPVSRVKERDTSRRRRSPGQLAARNQPSSQRGSHGASSVLVHSEVNFEARNISSENAETEVNVIAMLQRQLETVRKELERTRGRLSETESENDRLRTDTSGNCREVPRAGASAGASHSDSATDGDAELDRLRRSLQEAERDIWSKQEEIEILTRKLDYSVNELSDTETVLSSSLQDLDSERAKVTSLSDDWNRRVNAMEKQLRKTIQRLDERERHVKHDRKGEQQRGASAAAVAMVERNEDALVITQLQSKLAESEAKVAELTRKVEELESTLSRDCGECCQSMSSVASVKSEKRADETDDKENEIRLDSLRHFCHDQNRRLLATLRNETEFLQTMVDTKLVCTNGNSMSSDLAELSDDLIAVHQYIGEMEGHLDPSPMSCPDGFMKDFNFKEVLNRLIEVQGRFASLSRREDTSPMVSSDSGTRNGNAPVFSSVHASAHSNPTIPPTDIPINSRLHVPSLTSFSTYWNFDVSQLHMDLARSLASYLEKKYDESAHCTVLTSDDLRTILAETMAMEACLFSEMANVIEASKNEEHLKMTLKLRDIRNAFVMLRRLEDVLKDAADDQPLLAILEHRLDVNFFHILCEETRNFVLAEFKDLLSTFPVNWQKKMQFGPADSAERTMALKKLSKNLLRDSIVIGSNGEDALDLLRSTVLQEEIAHILARVEANLEQVGGDVSAMEDCKAISGAAYLTCSLCDRLMAKLDDRISKMVGESADGGTSQAVESVKSRVANFLRKLKHSHTTLGPAAANAANCRMSRVDAEFRREIDETDSVKMSDQAELKTLASLKSARAIVRGFRCWIEDYCEEDLKGIQRSTPAHIFEIRKDAGEGEFGGFLTAGWKLAECVAHYEPLTKHLFYRMVSNISAKLVAVQLSVFYECRMIGEGDSGLGRDGPTQIPFNDHTAQQGTKEQGRWKKQAPCDDRFSAPTNVAAEVAELEQEILEMQSYHADEMEGLKTAHAAEVEAMRRELATEQERRNKLYSDMTAMKEVTDHSLAMLERAHTQLLEDMKEEHRREIQRVTREYEKTLKEEKDATRHALDALQKAHESDLHKQAEKLRRSLSSRYSVDADDSEEDDEPFYRPDLQQSLQEISHQLSEVSTAYSAKCLETSRMEDQLREAEKLLTQMVSDGPAGDTVRNSGRLIALEDDLRTKLTEIRHYEERVRQLESDLSQTQELLASFLEKAKMNGSLQVHDESPSPVLPNTNGTHVDSASGSSEELDDDLAGEYQPKVIRRRGGGLNNRRGDSRYHSTPNLGLQAIADSYIQGNGEQKSRQGLTPDRILLELRNVMGLTVSERRKYFESLCKSAA